MTIKKKIAIGILLVVCGVMLLFASEVFFLANSGKLMPLMEESIGNTTSEIENFNPHLLQFIFTPVKLVSALLFSLTTGILILIFGPFKRNAPRATLSIFTPLILWLISAILIYKSQPSAPWQLWLILLVLVLLALVLTLTEKRNST